MGRGTLGGMSDGLSRRGFMRSVGVGATVGATVAASLPGSARASAEAAQGEVTDLLAPLVGRAFGDMTVRTAEPHLGGVALLVEDGSGQSFQIDVLRRGDDSPDGVREVGQLAFYLANRGNGRSASSEAHGCCLIDIADWTREAMGRNANVGAGLLSWQERQSAHPRGAFLVG